MASGAYQGHCPQPEYRADEDDVLRRLESLYPEVMLEEFLPKNTLIIQCFLDGAYYYKETNFPTAVLHSFLTFFRSCSQERRNVVLANLQTKLDSLVRYEEHPDNDIPF